MRKETILISLGMGFLLFAIRTQLKSQDLSSLFQLQLISLAGIVFGMKRHYTKVREHSPEFKITYGNAYWLGFRMCLIAALFSGLLYYVIPLNIFQVYETSKFIRSLDLALSTIIFGLVLTTFYSWHVVYGNFKKTT